MKLCKHICFFYQESRIQYVSRMIEEASKYPYPTDVFIHTNKIFPLTHFPKYDTVTVHLIGHDFTNSNPFLLPWRTRDLMKTQKNAYDIFIYVEDDILIPVNAILYWEKYNKILYPNKLNVGFFRIEVDSIGEEFVTDLQSQLSTMIVLNNELYCINNGNPYTAFWIYGKEEFSEFVNSPIYNLPDLQGKDVRGVKIRGYYIREAAAIGLHGIYDPSSIWYMHTIIPMISNTIHPDCRVYHMPNNYVTNPNTTHGSIRFDEIIPFSEKDVLNYEYVINRKRSRIHLNSNLN